MKKAWIENNTVRDICPGNPAECYHPDIAVHYNADVPDDTINGATLVNGEWVNPEPVAAAEPPAPEVHVSPVEFKLLWTVMERATITGLKATDPIVADFYSIIDDPRLTFVNLSLMSTQQAVDYLLAKLVEANTITAADEPTRRAEILSGAFK